MLKSNNKFNSGRWELTAVAAETLLATLDVLIASVLSMYNFSSFDIVLCALGVSDEKNHHATNHDRPNIPAQSTNHHSRIWRYTRHEVHQPCLHVLKYCDCGIIAVQRRSFIFVNEIIHSWRYLQQVSYSWCLFWKIAGTSDDFSHWRV